MFWSRNIFSRSRSGAGVKNFRLRTPLMRTWCDVRNFAWHRIRTHFSIWAVAGVFVVISQVKRWVNFDWIDDGKRSLNRARILKFEKYPVPDADWNILEQERCRSLKKWLPAEVAGVITIHVITVWLYECG